MKQNNIALRGAKIQRN